MTPFQTKKIGELITVAENTQDMVIETLTEVIVERCKAEEKTTLPINSVHEVRGVTIGEHDGKPYFVLELKDGIRDPRNASLFTLKHIFDWLKRTAS